MDVLKLALCLLSSVAIAKPIGQDGEAYDPRVDLIKEQAKKLCNSTDEYIATLEFLRGTKEILLPEHSARLIAEKVAKGCNGASARFQKTLRLFKSIGLSDPKSLEMALRFSAESPETQRAFVEIFSHAFLSEFHDFDFASATQLAFELSKDYRGEPAYAREDFVTLTRFCKDSKNLDLPAKTCNDYSIKMARLSQLYPGGVGKPFMELLKRLREDKEFGMDVKTALEFCFNILKNGPKGSDNFFSGYAYAVKQDGLSLGRPQALEFALKMSVRSFTGKQPPIIPAVQDVEEL